jgi:hypothetical protein
LIVLILPFLAGNLTTLKQGFEKLLNNKFYLILSFCIFLTIISIQFIYYKIATGQFFVYSYGEEGFNFRNPHIIDILFSYKKGLFLYTPIFLLSFTGGYFLWKSSKFEFFAFFAFFAFLTYTFSSWWMWYYGGSFSSRVYVEYISLFMILLSISLDKIKSKSIYRLFISLIVMLVIICQIQTYQYRYYDIHWSEMTKEKYWDAFLRIDRLIK